MIGKHIKILATLVETCRQEQIQKAEGKEDEPETTNILPDFVRIGPLKFT